MPRDLSQLSDDELAAEMGRRKKKGRTYRVREYEVDEETFAKHFGREKANGGDDEESDDDDDSDDDDEKPPKAKKKAGGYWD